MKRTMIAAVIGTLLAAPLVATPSFAQDYPTRSIRMVVPFAPGGGTDFSARTIAQSMTDSFGQTVIVDNKPGAATNIGAEIVAKAAPDGYTLLLSSGSTFAMNPAISKKTPYDTFRDFTPVGSFSRYVLLLVVAPDVPVKSVQEFITYARARPGQLSFGSPGLNSSHQLAMELFMQRTGLTMIHVPFKGAAPAMQEIIAGRVNSMFQDLATALQQIKAGKLRALGVASDKRLDRHRRAHRHAGCNHQQAECGNEQGARQSWPATKARRHRRRAPARHAGPVRRPAAARGRHMGRGHQEGQARRGVIGPGLLRFARSH